VSATARAEASFAAGPSSTNTSTVPDDPAVDAVVLPGPVIAREDGGTLVVMVMVVLVLVLDAEHPESHVHPPTAAAISATPRPDANRTPGARGVALRGPTERVNAQPIQ